MSIQGNNPIRLNQILLPDPIVSSIFSYVTGAALVTVCKCWKENAILIKEREKRLLILVFGRPGSGKGTLMAKVAEKMGFATLSMGDYFREQVVKKRSFKEFEHQIMNHLPVPLELVHEAVSEVIKSHANQGLMIDCFPRSIESIQFFDELMKKDYPYRRIVAIHIQLDPLVADERLKTRRVCEVCKKIFGKSREEFCCGRELKPRLDAKVQGRQNGFEEKYKPSFDRYKPDLIDGSQPPEEVLKQVEKWIK